MSSTENKTRTTAPAKWIGDLNADARLIKDVIHTYEDVEDVRLSTRSYKDIMTIGLQLIARLRNETA